MFHELRRKDRELSGTESISILENGEHGIFSTIGANGYPYGVPVNYVYKNDSVYFHCAAHEGHKLENIKNNNKVSFCVVGKTEILPNEFSTKYESVIVFGRAIHLNGKEKTNALVFLLEKYSPEFVEKGKKYIAKDEAKTGVVKIEVERMTGKAIK